MKYSVGELKHPSKDDPRFNTKEEAWNYARNASFPELILGVWCDDDGELIAVAYDGLVYWP